MILEAALSEKCVHLYGCGCSGGEGAILALLLEGSRTARHSADDTEEEGQPGDLSTCLSSRAYPQHLVVGDEVYPWWRM